MPWKRFLHLRGNNVGYAKIFGLFFVGSLNDLLFNHSSWRWSDRFYRSCNLTVITYISRQIQRRCNLNHDDVIRWKRFSALLVLCEGNPPIIGGFPSQRPVMRTFDVFYDLHQNKRLSKQSRRQRFQTPWCSLWRHCNVTFRRYLHTY